MSRKPHEPTEKTRSEVETLAAYGIPQEQIALMMEIDAKTLRKHYRRELDVGMPKANAKVAQSLFQKAINGDTTAAIFWAKTRMGWRETISLTGADGGPIETITRKIVDPQESGDGLGGG